MTSSLHKRGRLIIGFVTLLFQMLCFLGTPSTVNSQLSAAEQQELLVIHNNKRAGEGASDMQIMTWDSTLALIAQNWSDGCEYGHGQGINSSTLGELKMGQNLFAKSAGPANLTEAVVNWFNEKADYTYSSNTCASGKVCGHYTQVVWASSNRVGCGYTICPELFGTSWTNAVYVICNYAPGGNMAGLKPYQMGPPSTKCASGSFYSNQGLCDSSCTGPSSNCVCKAACQNCNTQTTDCRCQCGTGWTGVDCSAVCQNNDPNCGKGWPSSLCNDPTAPYVAEKCPLLCGACVAGTPAPCVTTANPNLSTMPSKPSVSPSSNSGNGKAPATGACLVVTSSSAKLISGPTSLTPNVIATYQTGAKFFSLGQIKTNADGTSWWKVSSVVGGKIGWINSKNLVRKYKIKSRKHKKSKSRHHRKFKC